MFTTPLDGITLGEVLHNNCRVLEAKGFGAQELTHRRSG